MTKNEMIYYHQRRITTKGRKLLKDGIKMSTENTANRCQITSRTHKTPARHRAGDKKTQLRELLCLFCSVEVLTGGARFHNPSICLQQKILFHSQLLTLALKVLWSSLFFLPALVFHSILLYIHIYTWEWSTQGAAGGGEESRSGVTLTFSQLLQWINLLVTGSPNKPTHKRPPGKWDQPSFGSTAWYFLRGLTDPLKPALC